jgi:hypothetical protein
MYIPSAIIQFRKLDVPWRYLCSRAQCPVHGREEHGDSCPYLAVLQAPLEYPIVITDLGSWCAEPAKLPGWEAIWMKGTGGGAHGYVAYVRHGFTTDQLEEFLRAHPSNDSWAIERRVSTIVVWSSHLGPWIGRNGRWAKAYQRLGIKVLFKDMREISAQCLSQCPENVQEIVKRNALSSGSVMRDHSRSHSTHFIYGLDPQGEGWRAVQATLGPNFKGGTQHH